MQADRIESLAVHKFINDYIIENKRIKPLAFNLFHRCALKCYKNPKMEESQILQCNQVCQKSRMRLTRIG